MTMVISTSVSSGAAQLYRQSVHAGDGFVPPALAGKGGGQGKRRFQISLHPLADGLGVPPECGIHPRQAPPLQVGIQLGKTLRPQYRCQEIGPCVSRYRLHIGLVIPLARRTEPAFEQMMGLPPGESLGTFAPTGPEYPGHPELGIVVQNALGRPAQKAKADAWPSRKASVVSPG